MYNDLPQDLDELPDEPYVYGSHRPKIETWVMTPEELDAVFRNSGIGDVIVYAVGDLGNERTVDYLPPRRWLQVHDAAELAMSLSGQGRARLTQKRLGPNKNEYRCQKVAA